MINRFNYLYLADIRKSIASKKKNVHHFTVGALKTTDKKVGEVWKRQKMDRFVFRAIYARDGFSYFDLDGGGGGRGKVLRRVLFHQN